MRAECGQQGGRAPRGLKTVAGSEVVGVKVSIICSQTDGQSDQLDLAKLSFWQNLEMRAAPSMQAIFAVRLYMAGVYPFARRASAGPNVLSVCAF